MQSVLYKKYAGDLERAYNEKAISVRKLKTGTVIEYIQKYDLTTFGRGISYDVREFGKNIYDIQHKAGLIDHHGEKHFYFQNCCINFDDVLCKYVLEHVDDVNEITRVLYMDDTARFALFGWIDHFTPSA